METNPGDPLGQVEELFNKSLTPKITREMQTLLEHEDGSGERTEAKRSAYKAIVELCDYLNRWNGDERGNPRNLTDRWDLARAGREIERALEIDSNLALAHYAQGFIHRTQGKHPEALSSFTRSLEIDDSYARAWAQRGAELLYLGLPVQALPAVRKAIDLSKGSPIRGMFFWYLGRIKSFMGHYEDAIPWLRLSTELWPKVYYNHLYLVSAYALIGEERHARKELEEFNTKFPDYTIKRVIENEKTNPATTAFFEEGRRRFQLGLRLAGMSE